MAASVPQSRPSPEVPDWSKVGRRPAKAGLPEMPLGSLIWAVLVQGHGSAKEAAFTMGIDRSLLRRKVLDGTLTLEELMKAEPRALATFGEFLVEHFGEASKYRAQLAREKIPQLLAAFLDIADGSK